jgi:hypothetical protein
MGRVKLSQAERELIVRLSDRGLISELYKHPFEFEAQLNDREARLTERERAVAGQPEALAPDLAAWEARLEERHAAVVRREQSAAYQLSKEKEQRILADQARLQAWHDALHSREFDLRLRVTSVERRERRVRADEILTYERMKLLRMIPSTDEGSST